MDVIKFDSIEHARGFVSEYENIESRFKKLGIKIENYWGVSDSEYNFIAAEANGETLFSSGDLGDFIKSADLFLSGVDYMSQEGDL